MKHVKRFTRSPCLAKIQSSPKKFGYLSENLTKQMDTNQASPINSCLNLSYLLSSKHCNKKGCFQILKHTLIKPSRRDKRYRYHLANGFTPGFSECIHQRCPCPTSLLVPFPRFIKQTTFRSDKRCGWKVCRPLDISSSLQPEQKSW